MAIRNLVLKKDTNSMHVIQFGSGRKQLIMIPGLGDGLTTVKGLALPFISYGGTNLMSALISIGMLINVSRQSDLQRQREKSKISAVFHIKGD